MKITYSNIQTEFRHAIEVEAEHHIEKLKRLLKRYAPDLVLLHGSLEKMPRKTEYNYSLNLTLPTGTLHATGAGPDVRSSVKAAFAELELQVKKHQEKLRKDYVWKRKRGRGVSKLGEATAGRGEAAD
jgi:ribosomal subunit interface protein